MLIKGLLGFRGVDQLVGVRCIARTAGGDQNKERAWKASGWLLNYGLRETNYRLLWGIVAFHVQHLGFPAELAKGSVLGGPLGGSGSSSPSKYLLLCCRVPPQNRSRE